jgi:hypothetical protein
MADKMRSLRGCPDYEWEQAVAAAARVKPRKQLVGEWIADAIRLKLAAEREPIAGVVEQRRPLAPWLQQHPLSLPDALELALKLADQRGGKAKGRIQQRRLRALNAALDERLGLYGNLSIGYDEPSNEPMPALSHDPSSEV